MSQSTAAARVPARPIVRPASRPRPQQPRLRVVAPTKRRSTTGLAMLCVGLLGGGLLALLLLNISIGQGAYVLTELQRDQRQLALDRQSLAEQVDAVSAPQQLAASARQLGMVPAPNTAFVRLPDGRVQGTPAKAEAPAKSNRSTSETSTSKTTKTSDTSKTRTDAKQSATKKKADSTTATKPSAAEPTR